MGVTIYKRAGGRQYLLLRPSGNAPQESSGFNDQEHQQAAEKPLCRQAIPQFP
jgi:hypothetical protein